MRRLLALLMAIGAVNPSVAAAEAGVDLKVVAHLDLDAPGEHRDVAVAGSTALVAPGECSAGPVTVLGLENPRRPAVVSTISLAAGPAAVDVSAGGVVAALAVGPCGPANETLLYDLTSRAEPVLTARYVDPALSIALTDRPDGRRLALSAGNRVRLADVSNPRAPAPLAVWIPPEAGECRDVRPFDQGRRAVALCGERGVYELDLASPSAPALARRTSVAARPDEVAVALLSDSTLALVSAGDAVFVLALPSDGAPQEVAVLRSPNGQPPRRAVASGELAFVAWRGDGLRVIDLGSAGYPAVARFLPPGPSVPDVVGVALLPDHVLVTDATSGLWVVERPKEGTKSSKKDDLRVFLAALGIAALLGLIVVPQLVAGAARIGSPVAQPAPARARRRVTRYPRNRRYG